MKRIIYFSLFCWLVLILFMSASSDPIEITKVQAENALNIIGVEMTDSEIDSLLPSLNDFRRSYTEMRKYNIENSTAPSLIFNPLPASFKFKQLRKPAVFENVLEMELPENLDDLAFYSINQLAYLIKNRKISSVDLTNFFLNRLKEHDQTLHCVINYTEERAMRQAEKLDEELANGNYRGLLHGIPFGAKDLLATSDAKTTWGATPFKDQQFDYNATVIVKLEEAGAVLLAKLTLGALAWGEVWYGEKTRNPWDPKQGSSGSSAGSASAVSAGLVTFALGTETLGSIVSPSTVCGTTGLRPSFGSVSRHGAMALSWSMDKIGPICRSTEDCAIVFDAIKGKDPFDASSIDAAFNYNSGRSVKNFRVAYLKSVFDTEYSFKEQDSLVLQKLMRAGVELIPVDLPDMPELELILIAEAAAAFDELTRSNKDDLLVRQIKNAWPNVFRAARFIPAVEYIQANRIRKKLIEEMDDLMQSFDVYLTPSWAGPNLTLTNLTGHPQLVMPDGFKDGKPTSISIVGQLYGEASLLEFGKYMQQVIGLQDEHPPLYK